MRDPSRNVSIFRDNPAVAEAAAEVAIDMMAQAIVGYSLGETTVAGTLEAMAQWGAEAERVLLAAWWPFHDQRAA